MNKNIKEDRTAVKSEIHLMLKYDRDNTNEDWNTTYS